MDDDPKSRDLCLPKMTERNLCDGASFWSVLPTLNGAEYPTVYWPQWKVLPVPLPFPKILTFRGDDRLAHSRNIGSTTGQHWSLIGKVVVETFML
jgi:hypothetical protein